MDRTEISEIFCGAVDTIINARLKNLAYDITKQFVITKNDLQRQGLYTVSDGSVSFEAYSYDKTLKINDKVMVTIPNGDYSQHKIITAKIEPEIPEVSTYASQLNLMQIFTDNIVNTNTIATFENKGLIANDLGSSSYIPICTLLNNKGDLSGYTRLGISAEFLSLLSNLDVVKGNYGLKLYIYSVLPNAPGEMLKENIYELYLDSSDMIGNPYKYNAFSKQEKVIDISMISNIARIEIYFYQDGNFMNGVNELIQWEHVNNILEIPIISYPNNLFVKNLLLFLGYELGEYENDKMQIYCNNSSFYSYADVDKTKHLSLKWIHKFDNDKYQPMDMKSLNDMGITLKWFKYKINNKNIDKIAGRNWEEIRVISNDKFKCDFIPDLTEAEERIKVIGYKVNITRESLSALTSKPEYRILYNLLMDKRSEYTEIAFEEALKQLQYSFLETKESTTIYSSEEFVLSNAVKVYDTATVNATSAISIYYHDGSDGNYFIYDTNGKLPTANKGRGYERKLEAIYNGLEITSLLGKLDWIEWHFPTGKDSKTMLVDTNSYYIKDNGLIVNENESYSGVNYICIRRYPNQEGKLNTLQSYSINNNWSNTYNNNTIRCIVSIDGIKHTASTTMRFGKSGTQGTNTTLVLELLDNHNAITVPPPTNELGEALRYTVKASITDINGEPISPTTGDWKWEWKIPMNKNKDNEELLILELHEDEKYKVDIIVNMKSLSAVRDGYYGILAATFKQTNNIDLTAYLSIPLKAPDFSHIEGATEITYSSAGAPSYYSDAYKIYKNTNDTSNTFIEIKDVDWNVVHDLEFYKLDKKGNPIINEFTGEREVSAMCVDYIPKLHLLFRTDDNGRTLIYLALLAAPFYAEGYSKICVTCELENGKYKSLGLIPYGDYIESTYYIQDEISKEYILSTSYKPRTEYFKKDTDIIWVLPLLITSNNYENMTVNNWDGTLMTDEGSSTIMATIIGAGRKNNDNTFSGILLGEVKDGDDSSDNNFILVEYVTEEDFYKGVYYFKDNNNNFTLAINYDKSEQYYVLRLATGLYGFLNGEISFSLKDTGIATFGKSNKGQIIIDGNESTITSRSYNNVGKGMHLDIDEGILTIKDNESTKVLLTPGINKLDETAPYLLINGINESKPIMSISGNECFLLSQSYSLGGLGTRFDLMEGKLDIHGTGGNVLLSGREQDPFFKVTTREGTPLINMDIDNYYLQSAYFSDDSLIRTTQDDLALEIYHEKPYIPVAISKNIYEQELYKYFTFNGSEYIQASGKYDPGILYYRQGNHDVVFGFDVSTNNLYTLNYDAEKDIFTARVPIDVYETNKNGNLVYPIMWYITRYDPVYIEVFISGEEMFEANKSNYYILKEKENEEDEDIYIPVPDNASWEGELTNYYVLDYIPVNNELEVFETEEELIGLQILSYVNRELEPVTVNRVPSGMKLNLVDGRIEGYNLKLIGTKINDKGDVYNQLIIDTDHDEIPFLIGDNFKIHWDGEMECTKVSIISYTPDTTDLPAAKGIYSNTARTTGYTLNLKTGTFNGTAASAESISEQILDDWFIRKTNDDLGDNKFVNWGFIQRYLNDNYVNKSSLPDFSNYITKIELQALEERISLLEQLI